MGVVGVVRVVFQKRYTEVTCLAVATSAFTETPSVGTEFGGGRLRFWILRV